MNFKTLIRIGNSEFCASCFTEFYSIGFLESKHDISLMYLFDDSYLPCSGSLCHESEMPLTKLAV